MNMKKGLLSIICSLLIMLIIPFSVSANGSLSAPFVGYNIYYYDYDTDTYITSYNVDLDDTNFKMSCTNMVNNGCMTYQQTSNGDITGTISLKGSTGVHNNTILKIELILDSNYVGYVNLTHSGTTKNYYVNGNKLEIYTTDTGQTITVNSYQLNRSNNSEFMYIFPIESWNFINQQFEKNRSIVAFYNHSQYTFPMFNANSGDVIGEVWCSNVGEQTILILGTQYNNNNSTVGNYLEFVNCKLVSAQELYYSNSMTIKKYILECTNPGFSQVKFKQNMNYMPIYFRRDYNQTDSSIDFALNFRLDNRFFNILNDIANGTTSSNASSSELDDNTNQLTQDIGQYTNIENGFNDDMNSHLNNIDTTSTLPSAMGSKFLSSANWVRVQFNRMTENTPFGSILGFSLVLGLSLLIIGKVYK